MTILKLFFICNLDFIHLFIINFLCIRSLHTFFFLKEHVTEKILENTTVSFALEFILKFLTMKIFLMILFLMSEILLPNSTNVSGKSLSSVDIYHVYLIYINAKNTKYFGCKFTEISKFHINFSVYF